MQVICAFVLFGLLVSVNGNSNTNIPSDIVELFDKNLNRITWRDFSTLANDITDMTIPVASSTSSAIDDFWSNLLLAKDEYHRARNALVEMCTSSSSPLSILLNDTHSAPGLFNSVLGNQMDKSKESLIQLKSFQRYMELAYSALGSMDSQFESSKSKEAIERPQELQTMKTNWANLIHRIGVTIEQIRDTVKSIEGQLSRFTPDDKSFPSTTEVKIVLDQCNAFLATALSTDNSQSLEPRSFKQRSTEDQHGKSAASVHQGYWNQSPWFLWKLIFCLFSFSKLSSVLIA